MIPAYLFLGGTAGMSATLSAGARLAGRRRLARRALVASVIAFLPCAPLLVWDLGRPARFHHMLRVFRVTSPMNVGTWILSAFGAALGVAATAEMAGSGMLAAPPGAAAGLLGPAVATYTGVLLANTSIPAWHGARRELPFLFAAGAAASAGAAACLLTPTDEAGPARRLAMGAALAEVVIARLMHHRLGPLGSTYRSGTGGRLSRASALLLLAGSAGIAVGGRRRTPAGAGSALILVGACAQRFAVWKAGDASAALS